MHTNIGERLAEARKRKGISLKEASEALKVRADFLKNFESNRFDFDLPFVYMQGFLKMYAKYLRLDHKKIMKDFDAIKNQHSKHPKKAARETLGRIALASEPEAQSPKNQRTEEQYSEESMSTEIPQGTSLKKGMIFSAGIMAFGVIALLAVMLLRSPSDASQGGQSSSIAQSSASNNQGEENIKIVSENTIQVIVRQESNKQRLYSGNVTAESPQSIAKKGPVKIHFSDGSTLVIEKENGERVRPGRSGVGWIEVS